MNKINSKYKSLRQLLLFLKKNEIRFRTLKGWRFFCKNEDYGK